MTYGMISAICQVYIKRESDSGGGNLVDRNKEKKEKKETKRRKKMKKEREERKEREKEKKRKEKEEGEGRSAALSSTGFPTVGVRWAKSSSPSTRRGLRSKS